MRVWASNEFSRRVKSILKLSTIFLKSVIFLDCLATSSWTWLTLWWARSSRTGFTKSSRNATTRLRRIGSLSLSLTLMLLLPSETQSTSQVSSTHEWWCLQRSVLTCVSIVASKGNGAHLMKSGSKRRRTQAEMKEQYDQKSLEDEVNRENAKKSSEQSDRIAALE